MCGIVGVYGHPEAANITYLGLHALQHRGQEAAGIVTSDGDRFHRGRSRASSPTRSRAASWSSCPATWPSATSATRPPATRRCATPSRSPSSTPRGSVAVAHNGNLVNAVELRERLEADGSIFQSTSRHRGASSTCIARSREPDIADRIADALAPGRGRLLAACS